MSTNVEYVISNGPAIKQLYEQDNWMRLANRLDSFQDSVHPHLRSHEDYKKLPLEKVDEIEGILIAAHAFAVVMKKVRGRLIGFVRQVQLESWHEDDEFFHQRLSSLDCLGREAWHHWISHRPYLEKETRFWALSALITSMRKFCELSQLGTKSLDELEGPWQELLRKLDLGWQWWAPLMVDESRPKSATLPATGLTRARLEEATRAAGGADVIDSIEAGPRSDVSVASTRTLLADNSPYSFDFRSSGDGQHVRTRAEKVREFRRAVDSNETGEYPGSDNLRSSEDNPGPVRRGKKREEESEGDAAASPPETAGAGSSSHSSCYWSDPDQSSHGSIRLRYKMDNTIGPPKSRFASLDTAAPESTAVICYFNQEGHCQRQELYPCEESCGNWAHGGRNCADLWRDPTTRALWTCPECSVATDEE